ncbi:MAG TPA: hypothetical protein VMF63_07485 [Opitutaceae bacterium]|nr:hypothetical protein [Opitutaceae bacterium]
MSFSRHRHVVWLTLALALGAGAGAAPDATDTTGQPAGPAGNATTVTAPQPVAPPALAAPPAPAAPAPKPSATVTPKPRPRLSNDVKSELAGQLPDWVKPPPPPPEAPPPPPLAEGEEVVQMPAVMVFADKLPRIDEKAWLTTKARDEVLKKWYLSDFDRSFLNRYTVPILGVSQEARANQMYEEDQRLRDMKSMQDQIDVLKKLDPQAAKELQQVSDQIFTRTGQE